MAERARHDPFEALRAPYVARFTLGRAVAALGAQFVTIAAGWELYERTGDAWALGLVGAFQIAPALLLALPAGGLADRFPRRHIVMLAQLLMGLVSFGLALVSWSGAPTALLYALLTLNAAGRALSAPAAATILAQIIDRRQFANAQAWLISSLKLATIAGPALAGLLIALTGSAGSTYALAGLGQLTFAAILTRLPVVRPDPTAAPGRARELLAGVGFIRRTPIFLAAITLDLFAMLLGGAFALLPIFARDLLEIGPAGLGLLRAAPAGGALLAALLATRLPPWQRPGQVLLLAVVGFGLATVGFGLAREVWLSLVCLFLVGGFDSVSMVIRQTLQQMITPDGLRGRVAAINGLFVTMSSELGSLESGATAALFGPVVSVVSGGLGALAVVAAIATWCPALARIGPLHRLGPADTTAEPRPARTALSS